MINRREPSELARGLMKAQAMKQALAQGTLQPKSKFQSFTASPGQKQSGWRDAQAETAARGGGYLERLMLTALMIIALFIMSAAIPAYAFDRSREIATLASCPTQQLRVEINVKAASSKADIMRTLKLFAQYPNLVFTPVAASKKRAAFVVGINDACSGGETCAEVSGWSQLQTELSAIRGVSVRCDLPAPASSKSDEPQRSSAQPAPTERGGVGGSN